VPIETLHFLIIAIQKTGSVSYMCIRLLFCAFVYYSHFYVASIMPINVLITFHGVRASTKNSAQCYQTDFSFNFSGWTRDYLGDET